MKVAIVNCFDTYEDRIDLLHNFFVSKGHEVTVIQSDFRHFKKVYRIESKKDYIFIKSKSYYKNMSLARMTSHYKFAKDAFEQIEKISPDLIYALIPPNSVAKFAADYKRNNQDVKLIFDLIDLWPETMPVGSIKTIPPFTFWKSMRDKNLKYADLILTECDLYQQILENVLYGLNKETLHLAKREIEITSEINISTDTVDLCYLGSINNIIDVSKIKKIIGSINKIKPTTLHIIGDGENKDYFIEEIVRVGAKVEYYGKIYDHQEKQNIFDKCHYGLNIMKDEVCVGLTMKSIDYLQHGLPIINNIQADTTKIVLKYGIGFNLTNENIDLISQQIVSTKTEDNHLMRKNTKEIFNKLFSQKVFNKKLNSVLEGIKFL